MNIQGLGNLRSASATVAEVADSGLVRAECEPGTSQHPVQAALYHLTGTPLQHLFAFLLLAFSPIVQWSLWAQLGLCCCRSSVGSTPRKSEKPAGPAQPTNEAHTGTKKQAPNTRKTTPQSFNASAPRTVASQTPSGVSDPEDSTAPEAMDAQRMVSLSALNLNESVDASNSTWGRDFSVGSAGPRVVTAGSAGWQRGVSAGSPTSRRRLSSPTARTVNMATLKPEPAVAASTMCRCVSRGVCCAPPPSPLLSKAWVHKQRMAAMVSLRSGEINMQTPSTYRMPASSSAATMHSVPSFGGTAFAGQRLWGQTRPSFASIAPGGATQARKRGSGIANDTLGATEVSVPCEACGEACEWMAGNACSLGLVVLSFLLAGAFAALLAARAQCDVRGDACRGVLQYTFVFLPLWALVLLALGGLLASLLKSAARIERLDLSPRHRRGSSRNLRSFEAGSVLCLRSVLTCGAAGLDLGLFTAARTARKGSVCRERRVLLGVLLTLAAVVQMALVFATLSAGGADKKWLPALLPLWGTLLVFWAGHIATAPLYSTAIQCLHRAAFLCAAASIMLGCATAQGLLGDSAPP